MFQLHRLLRIDPDFCDQLLQKAVVEKVMMNQPEQAPLRLRGIEIAMNRALRNP